MPHFARWSFEEEGSQRPRARPEGIHLEAGRELQAWRPFRDSERDLSRIERRSLLSFAVAPEGKTEISGCTSASDFLANSHPETSKEDSDAVASEPAARINRSWLRCGATRYQSCRSQLAIGRVVICSRQSAGLLFFETDPGSIPPYRPSGEGGLRYKRGREKFPTQKFRVAVRIGTRFSSHDHQGKMLP